MKRIIRKIGSNRGERRIWIEGKSLTEFDWNKGQLYVKEVHGRTYGTLASCAVIKLFKDSTKGKLKIAGGEDRPVIDLCGKYVTNTFSGFEKVSVKIYHDAIIIKGDLA